MKNIDIKFEELMKSRNVPANCIKETDYRSYPGISIPNLLEKIESGNGVFISGGVGTGKTQLAVDLMAELIQKKATKIKTFNFDKWDGKSTITDMNKSEMHYEYPSFIFLNVPRMLIELRDTFSDKSKESTMDVLNKYASYDYLILDDLGAEKASDWVLETLYTVINDRYSSGRPMIITSNKNIPEIAQSLSSRIASRIVEQCEIVKLTGNDKRLK